MDDTTNTTPKRKTTEVTIKDMTTQEQREKFPLEKHFTLSCVSVVDGKSYTGDFSIKKRGIGAIGRAGVIRARLNGGEQVDATTNYVHRMMAEVMVSVVEVKNADWFKELETLPDIDILTALHKEVDSFEASFRSSVG